SRSVKLTDPGSSTSTWLRSHPMEAIPGQEYEASVYSYNVQGNSELYVEFWDENDSYLSIVTGRNSTTGSWAPIVVQAIAPAGTAYVTVRLYQTAANIGTAFYDDAEFRPIDLKPETTLTNRSFERTELGRPFGWRAYGG